MELTGSTAMVSEASNPIGITLTNTLPMTLIMYMKMATIIMYYNGDYYKNGKWVFVKNSTET